MQPHLEEVERLKEEVVVLLKEKLKELKKDKFDFFFFNNDKTQAPAFQAFFLGKKKPAYSFEIAYLS